MLPSIGPNCILGGLGLDLVQRPEGQREPRLVHATGSWPCQCLIPTEPIRQQRWDRTHSDETTFREIFWWQTISNKGLNIAISVSALIRRDNFTKHNIVSYFYRSLATLTLYWIMRSHCGLRLLKSGSDRTIRRWSDKWSLLNGQPLVISCSYIWFWFIWAKFRSYQLLTIFADLKKGLWFLLEKAWNSTESDGAPGCVKGISRDQLLWWSDHKGL